MRNPDRFAIAIRSLVAFHPSAFMAEEMAARGWSLHDLTIRTMRTNDDYGVQMLAWQMYFSVHDPDLTLGDDAALKRLGVAFGVAPEFFANLQRAYREATPAARAEGEDSEWSRRAIAMAEANP